MFTDCEPRTDQCILIDLVPPVSAKATNASIVPVKAVHRKAKKVNVHIARHMTLAVQI
jgi:hypothetical protein